MLLNTHESLKIQQASIDGATRMFPQSRKGKKGRKSASADTDSSTPEPVDVFVDTIIGFLEKSTAYMRTVGNQVFALLSGAVQESTIDLIVTVRLLYSLTNENTTNLFRIATGAT